MSYCYHDFFLFLIQPLNLLVHDYQMGIVHPHLRINVFQANQALHRRRDLSIYHFDGNITDGSP